MATPFEQLETEGYAVFPRFLDTATTARIRAHMDSLLPQATPPEPGSEPPVHHLRHPIPGAIMAEILANPDLLDLAQRLLLSTDLRLLEQVLIRSDGGAGAPGPSGWHLDWAFLPGHYQARPRQTYFHMVHALSTVAPGGAGFTIVPGSHHLTYAAAARLGSAGELPKLKADPVGVAGIDVAKAIEVLAEDGDLLVFNPMALHSASRNVTAVPRYVYFASFFDVSAQQLEEAVNYTLYRNNYPFPVTLHDNLPPHLQPLLR